jgi:hypothetical protein
MPAFLICIPKSVLRGDVRIMLDKLGLCYNPSMSPLMVEEYSKSYQACLLGLPLTTVRL